MLDSVSIQRRLPEASFTTDGLEETEGFIRIAECHKPVTPVLWKGIFYLHASGPR